MSTKPPNWATSDAKRKLTCMINDKASKIHSTMTFGELYLMKEFHVYKRDNFRRNANRLYEQITGRKKSWPNSKAIATFEKAKPTASVESKTEKKKKVEPWKTSLAKAFLLKLLTDKDEPLKGMQPRAVYDSHEIFRQYKYDRFKANMKSLMEKVEWEKEQAKMDDEDLAHDMKLKPRNKATSRGYPFWHIHKAKRLLAADVKSGKNLHIAINPFSVTKYPTIQAKHIG